jgi:hypothetical protein
MMKITNSWLLKNGACNEGVVWVQSHKFKTDRELFKALIADNKIDWANWGIVRLMTHKEKVKYAVYAAKQVIEIYEIKYPVDKRPREAIEAAKKVLAKDTKENRAAAASASAASYAASSASSAASASAASYAAYAAASAAHAAYAAASAAIYAAYAADEKEKMQIKILNYGFKIMGLKP